MNNTSEICALRLSDMMKIQIVLCDAEAKTDFADVVDLFPGAKIVSKEEACNDTLGDIMILDNPTLEMLNEIKERGVTRDVPFFVMSSDLSMDFLAATVSSIKVTAIFKPDQIDDLIRSMGSKLNEIVRKRELDKFIEDKQ